LEKNRCQSLVENIKEVESNDAMQAMVLLSNGPTTFSAGLDIMEMYQPKADRLRLFWSSFQELYFTLYGSRLACIAAIEGHAPAAGCMLALSCDYRIMAASDVATKCHPKIGLNETKLGIVAPPWLAQQMIDCVGVRQAELSLSLGTLYTPEEALKIKLVDAVVPLTDVYSAARNEAQKWGAIPPQARVASKLLVRQPHIDKLRLTAEQDIDHFVQFVTSPKVQQSLAEYIAMISKKRK
jgi:3,2-trans-enoyl-CoA isomerase